MTRVRKIVCIAGVCLLGSALVGEPVAGDDQPAGTAEGRTDLLHARLWQAGRMLILTLHTARPVPLRSLDRLPAPRDRRARYLCLALRRASGKREKRLCVGGARNARHRVGMLGVDAAGHAVKARELPARVHRPSPRTLAVALPPPWAGLSPHRYRWRVIEGWERCPGGPTHSCGEALPKLGARTFRLRPVRVVGCTGGGAGLVRSGSRRRRAVALTFDDGPSTYTPGFLRVLRRERAHATFFVIGQEISGREGTLQRALREGHEIANHSTHHATLPGRGDLRATNALIEAATRFSPCLFRPPGGTVSSSVIDAAGSLGMRTVTWDVDPADWTTPAPGTIYSRVVGAVRPGSIVVMHDGGGYRGRTLAALPAIIDTLRDRGYRLVTVTRLLGGRLTYRPFG